MFAVNLGTGDIKSAVSLLEYCNFPGGTYYSDMRRENGQREAVWHPDVVPWKRDGRRLADRP